MSLVLEIECLTGVYRAAQGPASELPDWPPQPDRVFSALVSAWAVRGERRDERVALEWLEAQKPPTVRASGHVARTAPDVFVPPNDVKASKAEKTYIKVMPDRRPRHPRRFPVARPDEPVMALIWKEEPDATLCEALDAMARDIGYLGHSASLVRCRFHRGGSDTYPHPEVLARRRIYPGRLSELEAAHRANPVRPDIPPGASVPATMPTAVGASPPDWLVLEAIDVDEVPDIRAAALVCRALRRVLMSGYRRAELGGAIPEIVSGHTADRAPSRHPHLAIVPLVFAGFPHADSLSPTPYLCAARVWASVTPIVLDRHLKQNGEAEIRGIVADACERAGLPRPDTDRIRTGKHSAVEGAPPARPLVGAPPWTRWKVPESLATRSLIHAAIDFGREIPGPVLLGAGRFTGLGLCRRLES